jgi:hypothetical protein
VLCEYSNGIRSIRPLDDMRVMMLMKWKAEEVRLLERRNMSQRASNFLGTKQQQPHHALANLCYDALQSTCVDNAIDLYEVSRRLYTFGHSPAHL